MAKFWFVNYDIPKRDPETGRPPIKNPCPAFRERGIALSESCWAFEDSYVPWAYLDRMFLAPGVTWSAAPFEADSSRVLEMISISLRRKLSEVIAGGKRSQEKAADKVADESTDPDIGPVAAAKRCMKRTRAAARRTIRAIRSLEKAAKALTVDVGTLPFGGCLAAADGMLAAARARAALYADMVEKAAALPMGPAAETMPAGVLADYIEEHGGDAVAARSAFAEL